LYLRINYNTALAEAESAESVLMTFGQRLRELRNHKGLTQKELADRVGISLTYVSKLETGALPAPREKTIVGLANALDGELDELFGLAKKLPSHWLGQMNPEAARTLRSILKGDKLLKDSEADLREQMANRTTSGLELARPDEALRQREERFRAIVETSVDGIMIMNDDLDVIYENPSSARMLGYQPGELGGRDPLRIVHADDMSRLAGEFAHLLESPGGTARSAVRVRHADGTWRLIEAVGVNLIHDPTVKGIVMNFRDVTDRGREEEERSRSAAVMATAKRCGLTNSEKEVLALIVEGKSNHQISEHLVTSASTVKFHVGNILSKLGVTNRIGAVALVLQHRPNI
jgi:PAS domain S-box-containing protein